MVAHAMLTATNSWSANRVLAAAVHFGVTMRRQDAIAVLSDFRLPKKTPREPLLEAHESGSQQHLGNHLGTDLGTILPPRGSPATLPNPPLPFAIAKGSAPPKSGAQPSMKGRKKADNHGVLAWVEPVKNAARSLLSRTLGSLTAEERFVVARLHAYRFGNCIISESRNRLRASHIASGIVNLGTTSRFRDLTVKEYIQLGDAVLERRGGVPFFSAWEVVGAVEIEP